MRNQRRNISEYEDDRFIKIEYENDFDNHIQMFHEMSHIFNSVFMSPFGSIISK